MVEKGQKVKLGQHDGRGDRQLQHLGTARGYNVQGKGPIGSDAY